MKVGQIIIALVILILLGVGGYILLQGDEGTTGSTDQHSQGSSQESSQQNQEQVAEYPNLEDANIGETVDATGQSEVTVSIDDFIFNTTVLTVDKGTKVTWVNEGNIRHDVATASSSEIQNVNSELLGNGESFSFTFNESGQFDYFCSPHPTQMRGVVVVK
jgi:plastocyanin